MSDVVVVSLGSSNAREFVHQFANHHKSPLSDADKFDLRTKYYRVTLRVTGHDRDISQNRSGNSDDDSSMLFGYSHVDALCRDVEAMILLIDACETNVKKEKNNIF